MRSHHIFPDHDHFLSSKHEISSHLIKPWPYIWSINKKYLHNFQDHDQSLDQQTWVLIYSSKTLTMFLVNKYEVSSRFPRPWPFLVQQTWGSFNLPRPWPFLVQKHIVSSQKLPRPWPFTWPANMRYHHKFQVHDHFLVQKHIVSSQRLPWPWPFTCPTNLRSHHISKTMTNLLSK